MPPTSFIDRARRTFPGRRRLLIAGITLILGLGVAPPAEAHPIEDLAACWAATATAPRCSDGVVVVSGAGGRVDLRVRLTPAHVGDRVNLFRMRPPSSRWVHFATVTLGNHGRAHHLWRTQAADARPGIYRFMFQFQARSHPNHSNLVEVAVH